MSLQLDILAVADDAPEIRRRLVAAGVWSAPDGIGTPPVATYRVRQSLDGEMTVCFRYRRADGRAAPLAIAVHALVGAARIELEMTE